MVINYICRFYFDIFPDQFKSCYVHYHLKKSKLDKDDLGNYRLISHLSFLSKLTERVVKLRLVDYLSPNYLSPNYLSWAYCSILSNLNIKNHTETTLLSVHDHVINKSLVSLFLTYLLLLTLYIILFFLNVFHPWFGIPSTALSWIKSYLLNSSFNVLSIVYIENSKSSVFELILWSSSRIRHWPSTLHPIHHSSVLSYLIQQQTTTSMLKRVYLVSRSDRNSASHSERLITGRFGLCLCSGGFREVCL